MPAALYLSHLVADGEVSRDDRVACISALAHQDGAGILRFAARDGDTCSLRTLANLAATIGDSIAHYRMLARHVGKGGTATFIGDLGRDPGGEVVFPEGRDPTCAADMAGYAGEVLDSIRNHPDVGTRLLDDTPRPIHHVGPRGSCRRGL